MDLQKTLCLSKSDVPDNFVYSENVFSFFDVDKGILQTLFVNLEPDDFIFEYKYLGDNFVVCRNFLPPHNEESRESHLLFWKNNIVTKTYSGRFCNVGDGYVLSTTKYPKERGYRGGFWKIRIECYFRNLSVGDIDDHVGRCLDYVFKNNEEEMSLMKEVIFSEEFQSVGFNTLLYKNTLIAVQGKLREYDSLRRKANSLSDANLQWRLFDTMVAMKKYEKINDLITLENNQKEGILFYDTLVRSNSNFNSFSRIYQKYLITLHIIFSHPNIELSRIPKDVLVHKIIPFISEKSIVKSGDYHEILLRTLYKDDIISLLKEDRRSIYNFDEVLTIETLEKNPWKVLYSMIVLENYLPNYKVLLNREFEIRQEEEEGISIDESISDSISSRLFNTLPSIAILFNHIFSNEFMGLNNESDDQDINVILKLRTVALSIFQVFPKKHMISLSDTFGIIHKCISEEGSILPENCFEDLNDILILQYLSNNDFIYSREFINLCILILTENTNKSEIFYEHCLPELVFVKFFQRNFSIQDTSTVMENADEMIPSILQLMKIKKNDIKSITSIQSGLTFLLNQYHTTAMEFMLGKETENRPDYDLFLPVFHNSFPWKTDKIDIDSGLRYLFFLIPRLKPYLERFDIDRLVSRVKSFLRRDGNFSSDEHGTFDEFSYYSEMLEVVLKFVIYGKSLMIDQSTINEIVSLVFFRVCKELSGSHIPTCGYYKTVFSNFGELLRRNLGLRNKTNNRLEFFRKLELLYAEEDYISTNDLNENTCNYFLSLSYFIDIWLINVRNKMTSDQNFRVDEVEKENIEIIILCVLENTAMKPTLYKYVHYYSLIQTKYHRIAKSMISLFPNKRISQYLKDEFRFVLAKKFNDVLARKNEEEGGYYFQDLDIDYIVNELLTRIENVFSSYHPKICPIYTVIPFDELSKKEWDEILDISFMFFNFFHSRFSHCHSKTLSKIELKKKFSPRISRNLLLMCLSFPPELNTFHIASNLLKEAEMYRIEDDLSTCHITSNKEEEMLMKKERLKLKENTKY